MFRKNIAVKMYNALQDTMKTKYNRVLPLPELLTDRWEKARYLNFGAGTSVYDSSYVYGNVYIGKKTWIGPNTILDGSGGKLCIGNGCDISAGVQIYTHDTVLACIAGNKDYVRYGNVIIGDNCYIGPMSIIGKNVILGDYCIVGANSYVNRSFDCKSILAGNPAKKIGQVDFLENGELKLQYY